ncbi:hypothetical protein H1S01_12650 [Heliobacterium chlorum]|uniref:Uncharacterized protein n=1 Tax=Heliobacterium chlorum TaxID=2698 RepID=A0ABR7T3K7_HELCL|nr:hypothetical protein [Heliobacterium chlorum]MBC9785359.1 hypothetical protein [Heliobacterium chlorum]
MYIFIYHVPCIDNRKVFYGLVKANSETEAKSKVIELYRGNNIQIYTSQIELETVDLSGLESSAIRVGTFYHQ